MDLEQVKTPEGQAAVRADRFAVYLDRAVAYLEQCFPADMAPLTPAQRRAFANHVYDRSRARGLLKEADHLRYLGIAVYWGAEFESDPQHRAALRRAGWLAADGTPRPGGDLDAVYVAVASWRQLVEVDCLDPAGTEAMIRAASASAGDGPAIVEIALLDIWPNRMAVLPPAIRAELVDTACQEAAAIGLTGGMVTVSAVLAVHLGVWYLREARYSDLRDALATRDDDWTPCDALDAVIAQRIDLQAEVTE